METDNIKVIGHKRNDTKHKLAGIVARITSLAHPKHVLTELEIHELNIAKMLIEKLLEKDLWDIQTEKLGLKVRKKKSSL
jgi:hypothetical protein